MRRGIILEVQKRHWIVMTPDGSFEKVPNMNPYIQVGEEVELPVAKVKSINKKWIPIVGGAAAALLGVFVLISTFFTNDTYAAETYVYVDVNVGIEVGVDKDFQVVTVKALDPKAKSLVSQLEGDKRKSLQEFSESMIQQAKKDGLIQSKDKVVISVFDDQKQNVEVLSSIRNELEPTTASLQVDLSAVALPVTAKEHIQKTGLTPSKYAVWVLAKKIGEDIPLYEIEKTSITEVAQKNKSLEELLANPPSSNELDQIITDSEDTKVVPVEPTKETPAPPKQVETGTETPEKSTGTESTTNDSKETTTGSPSNNTDSNSGSSSGTDNNTSSNTSIEGISTPSIKSTTQDLSSKDEVSP